MLAIDYTFIDFAKEKENPFNNSLSLFSLDIIKGLCNLGLQEEICIITKYGDYDQAKKLLSEYKIIKFETVITRIIKILSKGRKNGKGISLRFPLLYKNFLKKRK